MTYRPFVLAALTVAGCAPAKDDLPIQEPAQVVAALTEVVRACSAGLTPQGSIDQSALAASGWRATRRQTRLEQQDRDLPLNQISRLRPGEYEVTRWARPGVTGEIELIRWEVGAGGADLLDKCTLTARVSGAAPVAQVLAGMTRHFGRRADRHGLVPRGGDFLTPRFDSAPMGDYWALPRHDVYMLSGDDGYLRLEVVAMPDRSRLDQYSSDRPEHRIPPQEGSP